MRINTVMGYLEASAKRYPDKLAFCDERRTLTYSMLQAETKRIAMSLIAKNAIKQPIAVYLEKSVGCVAAYMGVAYSGNFYSPLDVEMPVARIKKIMEVFNPQILITDKTHYENAKQFCDDAKIVLYEDAQTMTVDQGILQNVLDKIVDTDVLYVLFTSGSTGTPKGVVVPHRALVDFVDWAVTEYQFNETIVFGNQTPFYFSMSIWDIYITLYCGGSCHIIPQDLFMFPPQLMRHIKEKQINTLVWVPSALCLVANMRGLKKYHAEDLQWVFFGGEVMPVKQLNQWIKEYPDTTFVNIYGPTEVTDTFMAYTIDRPLVDHEAIPLGEPRDNHEIFIFNDKDEWISSDEIGELCVRGAGLAYGYYNNPEQTDKAFVQNPLNSAYSEKIYRSGDLVKYNGYGELVYVARKDLQVKHMGHRIELGEIEAALCSLEGIDVGCCLYDDRKSKIVAFYTGEKEEENLMQQLKLMLPSYMLPNIRVHLEEMPYNLNGKIDRMQLKQMIAEMKYR